VHILFYIGDQAPRTTQLGHPSTDKGDEYQPMGVTLCGGEIKAGMACVWWQVN